MRTLIGNAAHAAKQCQSDGDILPLETDEQQPVALLVFSLHSPDRFLESGAALILVHDPGQMPGPSVAALRELYGLTPAQAYLLIALINGERLGDYAQRTGVTADTAKFHLKQIFAKTGTSRQADLIRQVLVNPLFRLAPKQD